MLPNFLLIGPGRAGSDWITKNLSLHPDIFIPRAKGLSFFSRHYDRGIDWYTGCFGKRAEKAVGESSVEYLHTEGVPQRILDHIPDARFIVNLRQPVDRAYSSYGRLKSKARPDQINYSLSFEEKIEMTPRILEQGLYASHLQRWFSLFPKEQFLILTFDEMKAAPEEFLKRVFTFLDVDPDFVSPLTFQKLNATATIGSRSRLLYRVYRGMLRFNLFGVSKAIDTVNKVEKPSLNPETRRRLIEEYYADDISLLEQMTGKSLEHWRN